MMKSQFKQTITIILIVTQLFVVSIPVFENEVNNLTDIKNTFDTIVSTSLALPFIVFTNQHNDIQISEHNEYVRDSSYIIRIKNADMFFDIVDGFVYFGRDTCPVCYRFMPILFDVVNEEQIQVFYFDTVYFRNHSLLTNDELQSIFADYQITHVPIIIRLTDGQLDSSFTPAFSDDEDNINIVKNSTRDFLCSERKSH